MPGKAEGEEIEIRLRSKAFHQTKGDIIVYIYVCMGDSLLAVSLFPIDFSLN